MMNTERAHNFAFRPAKIQQSLGGLFAIYVSVKVCARSVFKFVMLLACHYNQIIWGIVQAVAVNVMNGLTRSKRPADNLFCNEAMFKVFPSAIVNDTITLSVDMSPLPIPMVGTKLSAYSFVLSTSDWTFAQLFKSGGAESWITKCFVFFGCHLMGDAQMGGRYLHRTDKAAQLASDRIFNHGIFSYREIIPQRSIVYYVGV